MFPPRNVRSAFCCGSPVLKRLTSAQIPMPRLSNFGTLPCIVTCVAALSSAPIFAQTPAANSPRVQHVIVRGSDVSGSGAAIEGERQTSGSLAPDTQAITGPDRIVADFPGA